MFIMHAASEWLYWRKHRYLEFQQSKHRFSSNIADIPRIQWWISKSSGFMQKSLSVKKNPIHILCTAPGILLWSCISNPIRPDNLGCVGSHYNQKQEHQEHNLIFDLKGRLVTAPGYRVGGKLRGCCRARLTFIKASNLFERIHRVLSKPIKRTAQGNNSRNHFSVSTRYQTIFLHYRFLNFLLN